MVLVTVSGQYLTTKGLSVVGFIRFTPRLITGGNLPVTPVTVPLDVTGSFSVNLTATDSIVGLSWTYEVSENLFGVERTYELDVLTSSQAAGIDLPSASPQPALNAALRVANNLSDVANAGTARTNLGLGNVDNTADANKPVSVALNATLARNPDLLISGAVTRDANGAATSAPVTWPNGAPGTYTSLVVSTTFPGAVDSYRITYGSPTTATYTQPTVTRDASSGAVTNVPAIVVT